MTMRAWFHRMSLLGVSCFAAGMLGSCDRSSTHGSARDAAALDAARDGSSPPAAACKQDGDCDDGTYCDGVERCTQGLCAPGKPVKCDDGIACTTDSCSEAKHACAFLAPDRDADGHYDSACKGKDGKPLGDDCDDSDGHRFPGNIEVCDPKHHDEDCDPKTIGAKDSDADGFVDARCCDPESDAPNAKLHCGDDCDDLKKNVNPKATEACDGFDNNCNGETDEGVTVMMYPDRDFDGRGSNKLDKSWNCKGVKSEYLQRVPKKVCAGEKGYSPFGDDCNDCDPNIYPGQLEICDGKDNDCNGRVDERHDEAQWYPDVDGDSFGDLNAVSPDVVKSCEPVKNHVLIATDCDDHDAARNPAADEVCDGKDNDCRNGADYKIHTNDFEDDDGDHIADFQCGAGATDCDDNDPTTGSGDVEICDQRDNDCDGAVDEGVTSTVWYADRDGDGYGDDTAPEQVYCGVIPGRTALPGDCDDTNPSIHPHAVEICDNINQDCDSQTDESPADAQCSFPHASAYCARGSCRVDLCNSGYHDCDGDPSNGCEAHVTSCSGVTSGSGGSGGSGGGGTGGTPGPILPIDCQTGTMTSGDVMITGTDFSALKGVHCLNGSLHITGIGTTDLAPLSALQWIGGGLTIDSNAQLVTLVGLDNLTTIRGGLYISSNGALKNVDGLDALTTLGGTLTLYNNVSVLNLSGLDALTSVPGNVDIEYSSSLYSLALPSLQQIGGSLTLYNDPGILLIDGFGAVQKIGGNVSIQTNSSVGDITGFASLTQVGGYVDIFANGALTKVQGFASLTDVGANVRIYNNARLAALPGFGNLNWVRSTLEIHDNHDLTTIAGFGKLTRVSGDMLIYNNTLLTTLAGFAKLNTLDANLTIQSNPQLASITGFAALQTVQGKLTVSTNDALAAIDGMGALQSVGDALSIQDNVALASISGLNSGTFLRLGNTLAIASNVNLSRCQVDVLHARLVNAAIAFTGVDQSCCNQGCASCFGAGCDGTIGGTGGTQGQSGVYTGDVTINTAADLAIFANVVQIVGNLNVNSTTLPNLGGLANLQQVTGTIHIASNASMTSLMGLGALTTVGGTLNLDSNAALTSIAALSSLTSVGGQLRLYNNTALASLAGLQKLVTIGGGLDLEYGSALTQVDDLSSLQTIGGALEVYNNAITHLDTWAALTSIGGIIEIQGNGALVSISGFAALTNAGSDLRIFSNASLGTIDGFGMLTKLNAGNLQIHDDANLTHIGGFGALQTLPGTLEIYQDGSLNPLDGFANLTSVGSNLSIYNMGSLASVTGFAKLAAVHGVLSLTGDSALTHLSGFALLNHVYGDFTLASNAALIDVSGFPALHAIDGVMTVSDNASLTSFDGISTLATVGKDLVIARNPVLTDIDGLSSGTLTSIHNNLQITVNPLLLRCRVDVFKNLLAAASPGLSGTDLDSANAGCTTCAAKTCQSGSGTTNGQSGVYLGSISLSGNTVKASDLALFRYVTSTSGNVNIDSTALTTLNGLDQLQHVGGQLRLYNNTGLATIGSLSKLTAVDGSVDIEYNSFTSLGGLANLTGIGSFLTVYDNGALTDLDGLSKLVSIGGALNLSSNPALTSIDGIVATATGHLVTLGGVLTVQNSGLTQCAPAALVAALQAHGYAGSTTITGNVACAKTCVGTLCQ